MVKRKEKVPNNGPHLSGQCGKKHKKVVVEFKQINASGEDVVASCFLQSFWNLCFCRSSAGPIERAKIYGVKVSAFSLSPASLACFSPRRGCFRRAA